VQELCETEQQPPTLLDCIRNLALCLWKDWPNNMRLTVLGSQQDRFSLRGECPHCKHPCGFSMVGGPHVTEITGRFGHDIRQVVSAMQCQGCLQFILSIITYNRTMGALAIPVVYYPLGKPDDSVSEDIPPEVASDFSEALRCRWVDAYNATVEMCRRAIEGSCLEQGAPEDLVLAKMIDWVYGQGKITVSLRDLAHQIKLGGNRAAHPSDRTITAEDADAVITFTTQYLQYVYVMPAAARRVNFDKPEKV
jgi:Domain of unknown function (DUF4145)